MPCHAMPSSAAMSALTGCDHTPRLPALWPSPAADYFYVPVLTSCFIEPVRWVGWGGSAARPPHLSTCHHRASCQWQHQRWWWPISCLPAEVFNQCDGGSCATLLLLPHAAAAVVNAPASPTLTHSSFPTLSPTPSAFYSAAAARFPYSAGARPTACATFGMVCTRCGCTASPTCCLRRSTGSSRTTPTGEQVLEGGGRGMAGACAIHVGEGCTAPSLPRALQQHTADPTSLPVLPYPALPCSVLPSGRSLPQDWRGRSGPHRCHPTSVGPLTASIFTVFAPAALPAGTGGAGGTTSGWYPTMRHPATCPPRYEAA